MGACPFIVLFGQDVRPCSGQQVVGLREARRELLSHPGVLGPSLFTLGLGEDRAHEGGYWQRAHSRVELPEPDDDCAMKSGIGPAVATSVEPVDESRLGPQALWIVPGGDEQGGR